MNSMKTRVKSRKQESMLFRINASLKTKLFSILNLKQRRTVKEWKKAKELEEVVTIIMN